MEFHGQVRKHAVYVPTGRIWPSGDFSLGYRKVDGDERVDYRSESERLAAGAWAMPGDGDYPVGAWGFPVVDAYSGWSDMAPEDWEYLHDDWIPGMSCCSGASCPLDLTTPRNSHRISNRPEKYGRQGITALGRKMVKSAAMLIQKSPGKRTTFCTITMPTLPQHLRRELALLWPEFLRQLIQWLSRRLKSIGLPALICSVTEVQPGRLRENSEAYLHLHLVWSNHFAKSGNWSIDCVELKTWCSEFLQSRGVWVADAWVNVDTQQVKKTAAGYLSKYMSKGGDSLEAFAADCGWDAIPGQWWNLSKPARDLVNKFTHSGDMVGHLLDTVINHSLNFQELSQYHVLLPAILTWEGGERIAGWYGVLTSEFRRELVSMIRAAEHATISA